MAARDKIAPTVATLMMGSFLKEPEATFKWYTGSVKGLTPYERAVYLLYLAERQRVRSDVFVDASGWDAWWVEPLMDLGARWPRLQDLVAHIQSKFKKGWVPSLEP